MPGVPSSRGCDACRKQKIKCHSVNTKPPCSRCHRLRIPCAGLGTQRFKFVDEGKQGALRNRRSTTANNKSPDDFNKQCVIGKPSYTLANRLTRLISAFVSNIDPSADIKIQLPWNFGDFLSDIPRRLGTNEALDAASEALVTAYTNFVAGDTVASPDVLIKHSNALNALRRVLDDPVKSHSSETLCSTMVLMIVQTLPGLNGNGMRGHSVGAAQILLGRGYTGPKDDFETKLLLSLRGPVAIEGMFNSKVTMTQEQWKDLVYNQIDSETIDGQMMKCLAQLPDLMYRGRCASKISALPVSTLPSLQVEVRTLSDSFRPTLTNLRERWRDTDSSIAMRYPEHMNLRGIIHAHYSRSYGMALALGIILNCMVAALEDKTPELSEDSSQMVDEVLNLARTVDQYRPLGTLYMVLCLGAAWVGATDSIRKAMLETLLINYHKDLHGASSTFFPHGLKLMETLFTLK